ncbi:hypothetical protein [uncultured Nostoc sp.]
MAIYLSRQFNTACSTDNLVCGALLTSSLQPKASCTWVMADSLRVGLII